MFFSFIELNYFELRLSVSYRPANWYVLQQITFAIQKKKICLMIFCFWILEVARQICILKFSVLPKSSKHS